AFLFPPHPLCLAAPVERGRARAKAVRPRGVSSAGAQVRGALGPGVGLHRGAGPGRPRRPPDGKCLRRILAAGIGGRAGRGAAWGEDLLLLLRFRRRQRRILVSDHRRRGQAAPRANRRGLPVAVSPGARVRRVLEGSPQNPILSRGDAMTNDVYIIGTGQTAVGEHWGLGMRELASAAVADAIADAKTEGVDALYVGNMLGGALNGQENVATLIADAVGLMPAEALKIEAACASGAAAVRAAFVAVASGAHPLAVAVGVEKMTDAPSDVVTSALATAADQDFEASHGL